MSEIAYTEDSTTRGVVVVSWVGLANGDTGAPYLAPHFSDKCIQADNTFSTGGSANIEGTNDPLAANYSTLHASDGNALTFTAEGIEQISENPYLLRPNITAGDGSTDINVRMVITTMARG